MYTCIDISMYYTYMLSTYDVYVYVYIYIYIYIYIHVDRPYGYPKLS